AGTADAATAASYTQIASALGAVVGTLLAAYCAEWFNRRWSYFFLCVLSLLVCGYLFRAPYYFGWTGVPAFESAFANPMQFGTKYLVLAGLAGCVTASFYGWLPLYLPELFPTRIRATGQGFAFNFGRVIAAVGALQGGLLLDYFGEDYARMCSIVS